MVTVLVSQWLWPNWPNTLLISTGIGATAVTMVMLPESPVSSFRAVIFGNIVGAVAGVLAVQTGLPFEWQASLAVALGLALMILTDTVHPASGGVSLIAVVTQQTSFWFVLIPVALNVLILWLVIVAVDRVTKSKHTLT